MKALKGWIAGLLALAGIALIGGTASAATMQPPALITPASTQAKAGDAAATCYHPFLHGARPYYGWHRHYGWRPYYGWHRPYGWRPYRYYGWHPFYRPIYRPWGYYHPWHRYGWHRYGWGWHGYGWHHHWRRW